MQRTKKLKPGVFRAFEKMFLINGVPQASFVSFRWLDNSQIYKIPLAEGNIEIN